jgi:cell division protein FtsB
MPETLLHFLTRHKSLLLGTGMVLTLGWAVLNGAQGFQDFREKQAEIRRLQGQNVALEKENARRLEFIQKLESSPSDQDLEIRKMNLLKPGEKMLMLPENERPQTKQKH